MARRKVQANSEDAITLAAATACASILVNIAQALEHQGTSRQAKALGRHRDHLVEVLRNWQKAYGDLKLRLDQRERVLDATQRGFAETRADLRRQTDELERLRAENGRLLAQLSKLEAQGAKPRRSEERESNA